tara:strand:+ start:3086 stop:3313 length:228 start_codon:yes stop_codon:yes gene_type:complete
MKETNKKIKDAMMDINIGVIKANDALNKLPYEQHEEIDVLRDKLVNITNHVIDINERTGVINPLLNPKNTNEDDY